MYFCVVFVLRSATQRKTNAAGEIKRKSSVFTNNSVNISLRLFYNSLPLPRMCYVLVSNGWLDSRSNSNICKSACAGERHVFGIWGIGQFHHPYSRQWHRENAGFRSTACCARNVYCDNQGKQQYMILLNS